MTGQTIVNAVVGASGITMTSNKSQLSYNVGELSTQELSSTKQLLTEGFLQPQLSRNSVNGLFINGSKSNNHYAYPNPFINSFQVSGGETIAKIKILDKNDKIIQESSDLSTPIDLSNSPSGLYLALLLDVNQKIIAVIKTIKQ